MSASAKQKCLAHLKRDLESLKTSRFSGNQQFASDVEKVLEIARAYYQDYQAGKLNQEALASTRTLVEAQLQDILNNPPPKGWPYDAQRLTRST